MPPADTNAAAFALDPHNRLLLDRVRPGDWVNPEPKDHYHLVVIGAGAAGLISAIVAASLGAKVAIVEQHLMGGDCLNVGCVPSKSVIASSRAAAAMRDARRFGVRPGEGGADFAEVMARMRRLRAHIGEADSAQRYKDHGVDVFFGRGTFAGRNTVEVGGKTLRFARAVIATGARAAIPPIDGLAEAGCLTNESVFDLAELPARLAVIGAGPIGCELAQAFQRLGSAVTVIEMTPGILGKEEPDAAALVRKSMERDGVEFLLHTAIRRVRREEGARRIEAVTGIHEQTVEVDAILVGAGRMPNVEGLGLEAAGVEYDRVSGVTVDDHLRTSNHSVYAAGDICMAWKFTHAADVAAQIVVQNALFSLGPIGRRKLSSVVLPWTTYTDPEVAHVGLYEHEASLRKIEVDVYTQPMSQVDRAILDGDEEGYVRVLAARGTDRILGATIVARHAGDMMGEIVLAMTNGLGLGALATVVHPYPTQSEAIKKAAGQYRKTKLTPSARWVLARLLALRA